MIKIYVLKKWNPDKIVSGEGYWENVKATVNEWEANHWIKSESGEPDMSHDYDEYELETPEPKTIMDIKKEIDAHKAEIWKLKRQADKLWVKPDCNKCACRDSMCIPEPFDCTGFKEDTQIG